MAESISQDGVRRVFLMRHADVRYVDAAGRPVAPEGVGLTEEGLRQAAAARDALAPVALDRIVCSGLRRTLETAGIVAAGRRLAIKVREELQEIRTGRIGDIPGGELEEVFRGSLERPQTRDSRFLGGETWGSLQDRVLPCFRALLAEPGWRRLLVVAHGGVNRAILLDLLGAGLDSLPRLEQDPACINVLDVLAAGGLMVRLLNHTPYDAVKAGLTETTMARLYRDMSP